jgi:hypothetical protein
MKKSLSALVLLLSLLFAYGQESPKESEKQTINIESLRDRLETLKKGREQAIADVNAYGGAIQECEYWIKYLQENKENKGQKSEPQRTRKPEPK